MYVTEPNNNNKIYNYMVISIQKPASHDMNRVKFKFQTIFERFMNNISDNALMI